MEIQVTYRETENVVACEEPRAARRVDLQQTDNIMTQICGMILALSRLQRWISADMFDKTFADFVSFQISSVCTLIDNKN